MIQLARVYHHLEPGDSDGARFLVERLWPRGIQKTRLELDGWLKDVAPSTELRKWYGHEPARWKEFQRRYARELSSHDEALAPLLEAARQGDVTLLYSARDEDHNSAVVLKDYLEKQRRRPARRRPRRRPTVH
ncbi:DUF488 family protein [Myxococcus sp. XM-1-1-1]|uniref:DUF488 domain-containing protein n=1 Tax=Myxococcus sp. XM-1-1-1 TaxID=2874602 RepID=UPI001CC0D770|nr:DUF488 family protein [Myxococcus sp. XM-1-1-1]MBZ4413115.1 DUF488 family protein [Myxococcus sp. XM-1-1-1]